MSTKGKMKHDTGESIEHTLSTTEAFIEKYQKHILIGITVIVALVLIVLSVRNFYIKPREITAETEIAKAQQYFATNSYDEALNGDGGECIGFKEIASEYSITTSGNIASAYAGICYYKLGEYDNAIKYLSQYDGKDSNFKVTVIGLIGDAYAELDDAAKAISYFEKAGAMKNEVLSPIYLKKAGVAYESLSQPQKALKLYTEIKESYSKSAEASDIDKYIARVQ